jgi:hypothetical protein
MTGEPRYAFTDPNLVRIYGVERCLDCGALICTEDKPAHTRFHSILSSMAWALAILKNTHLSAQVHDRYNAVERINSRWFDNWSADALAEVMKEMDDK